jgi:hypothetical protein
MAGLHFFRVFFIYNENYKMELSDSKIMAKKLRFQVVLICGSPGGPSSTGSRPVRRWSRPYRPNRGPLCRRHRSGLWRCRRCRCSCRLHRCDFQYTFSKLWKVKSFCANIQSLSLDTYFWGTVIYCLSNIHFYIWHWPGPNLHRPFSSSKG